MGHGKAQKREDLPCLRVVVVGVDVLSFLSSLCAFGFGAGKKTPRRKREIAVLGSKLKHQLRGLVVLEREWENEKFSERVYVWSGGIGEFWRGGIARRREGQLVTVGMESVGGFEGEKVSGGLVIIATR
jgi:hypothetical protein